MEVFGGLLIVGAIFALVWFYERAETRPCPRCGHKVGKGAMECGRCGFDFNTIGRNA
jgi:hypothetical protein